ncbi:hypothetical protein G647_06051 [Cladophialophora carrionii CBS 160.54]|uniref:Uncharacterized protein n=1 Tax=Cladophialophora carrionii CBS 160.54 TaxID=1279043 RepID=V9D5Q6_9EURO|nr:uncharacterized protein G647_06051 [Cladophialophora carrionii CBS 160.54]ETI21981.1 hypothetical protein G647_06051 [Cladophialophora carrionii CBS 160.54]
MEEGGTPIKGFQRLDKNDVEAFFQTWLYFGTLVSVFNIGGVAIKENDFLEAHGVETYLTTNRLNANIATWQSQWAGRSAPTQRKSA